MADDDTTGDGPPPEAAEDAALRATLAAEHAAVWGYGVVGAALPADARGGATAAENAHRGVRDRLTGLLEDRDLDAEPASGGYTLPFPVLSPVDAAALAVVLEEGVAGAWVRLLDAAEQPELRELAVAELGAAEVRAVGWRAAAGRTPRTTAFPGLDPA